MGSKEYCQLTRLDGSHRQKFAQWYLRDGEAGTLVPTDPDPEENPAAEAVISAALKGIRGAVDAAAAQLHLERHRWDITSISIPQYWNDTMRTAVFRAAATASDSSSEAAIITNPRQVRRYYNAARLAYRLDSCEGLGLKKSGSSTCSLETLRNGPHSVVFVDVNEPFLELAIFDVESNACIQVAREKLTSESLGSVRTILSLSVLHCTRPREP